MEVKGSATDKVKPTHSPRELWQREEIMLWGATLSGPVHAVVCIHPEDGVDLKRRNGFLSGSNAGCGAGPEMHSLEAAVGGVRGCHSIGVR